MKKGLLVFFVLFFLVTGAVSSDEIYRETVPLNWDTDAFNISRYTDSYLRKYRYYYISYEVKDNANAGPWANQVQTITYADPDYILVSEAHNYYLITYYFSDTQLINRQSRIDYMISPYKPGGDVVQFIRMYNSMIERIKILLADKRVSSEELQEVDQRFLTGSRKILE
ncbi:hypothetical protein FACS189483_04180 [Spirochaetia bacterium]|nr:hypothetical protein FACS189483_04180 [Spirochaetia bacterium]